MAYQNSPGRVYEVTMQQDSYVAGERRRDYMLLPPGVSAEQYGPCPRQPPPGLAVVESVGFSQWLLQNLQWETPLVSHPPVLWTNRNISLFTHMAAFIDEDGIDPRDHPRCDLDCTICGEYKLEMPPHLSMYAPDDEDAYFKVEPFTVVPCGHIFGYHCLSRWVWEEITDSKTPGCPICRLELVHPGCGHLVRILPYNVKASRRSQLPQTIHEGGMLNEFCGQCNEEIFENALIDIQESVYPSDHPARSYRDPTAEGPARSEQRSREMIANLQRLFRESHDRMLRW